MKWLTVPLITMILAACSPQEVNKIKPKLFHDYFTGLESQTVTDYNSIELDYDLSSRKGENVHFSNCKQVEATSDNDIAVSEYHLLTMIRINCIALKKYSHAGNAHTSHLQEILKNKDIRNLPATAYPYVNEYDKKSRLGKMLKEYHKKLDVSLADDGAITVVTETDRLRYEVLATGDFNADKIEDALIRINWRVIDAFGKGFKLIMVTRKVADQGYEITELN